MKLLLTLVALFTAQSVAGIFEDDDYVDLHIAFKRYTDTNCQHEMNGQSEYNYDNLHNPKCKTWNHHKPFHSYMFLRAREQDDSPMPKGADTCRVITFQEPGCKGESKTTDEYAPEAFDGCTSFETLAATGAKSVRVLCAGDDKRKDDWD